MNPILNNEQIKYYLENDPKQFRIFDIPYLSKTKKCLDNFKIEKGISYINYGDNNLEDLKEFLTKIGSNTEEDINLMDKTIKDLTKIIMSSVDKKYTNYWLKVASTLSYDDYIDKRWHCDGNYFGFYDDDREQRLDMYKFITILQGPGTFFFKTTPKERKLFESIQKEELEKSKIRDSTIQFPERFDTEYRKNLDSRIEGIRIQAEKYQGAIFITNVNNINKNICGIHSEPHINVPRMLFSIVPCTKEEAEMHKNKHKTIMIMNGGNNDNKFYYKYMKYKEKYMQLKYAPL